MGQTQPIKVYSPRKLGHFTCFGDRIWSSYIVQFGHLFWSSKQSSLGVIFDSKLQTFILLVSNLHAHHFTTYHVCQVPNKLVPHHSSQLSMEYLCSCTMSFNLVFQSNTSKLYLLIHMIYFFCFFLFTMYLFLVHKLNSS